jgi:hypothetical protein
VPAALYPPKRFLVLISVTGCVYPKAIVRAKGLGKLEKNPITSSGIEPATFGLQHSASTNYATACPHGIKDGTIHSQTAIITIMFLLLYLRKTIKNCHS